MRLDTWLSSLVPRKSTANKAACASLGTGGANPLRCEQLEDRTLPSATIRVATYNIEADINGDTTPLPGLYQVLEGIGEEKVQGDVQPLDILSLEETTSNSDDNRPDRQQPEQLLQRIGGLRPEPLSGDAKRQQHDRQRPQRSRLQHLDVESAGVGGSRHARGVDQRRIPPGGPLRIPAGRRHGTTGIFYVYVSHMKSGTTSADATDRGEEATIIRNDEASLPANASVLYMGDLNSAPPEAEFTNFTAAGQGEAYDPVNFSTSVQYYSESDTDLRYRDDYQLMTANVLNDTAGGFDYVSGTLHNFGNNGTTPANGSVNSGSDTALNSDLVQDGPPIHFGLHALRRLDHGQRSLAGRCGLRCAYRRSIDRLVRDRPEHRDGRRFEYADGQQRDGRRRHDYRSQLLPREQRHERLADRVGYAGGQRRAEWDDLDAGFGLARPGGGDVHVLRGGDGQQQPRQ